MEGGESKHSSLVSIQLVPAPSSCPPITDALNEIHTLTMALVGVEDCHEALSSRFTLHYLSPQQVCQLKFWMPS